MENVNLTKARLRVLVCGDRNWTDEKVIKTIIDELPEDSVILEGDCRGADRIAGECAKARGLKLEIYPAEWNKYGKLAGPIRNQKMLDMLPDVVFAFHDDILSSKGTKNMVDLAYKSKVPVILFSSVKRGNHVY